MVTGPHLVRVRGIIHANLSASLKQHDAANRVVRCPLVIGLRGGQPILFGRIHSGLPNAKYTLSKCVDRVTIAASAMIK